MVRALRPLLALLAVAAALALPAFAAQTSATVVVKRDGTVEALIRTTAEPGLNAYPAPAPPLPTTIIAEVDGKTVPVVYDNGTIYVATDKPANVTITYLVNTTVRDGYAEFNLGQGRVLLCLEPGVVLLNLPQEIESVKQLPDGSLEVMLKGPAVIRYTVAQPPQPPATATTTTATTATTATTTRTRIATTTTTGATATTTEAATKSPASTGTTRRTGATATTQAREVETATQQPAATATVTATGATTTPRAGGVPATAVAAVVVAVAVAVAALLLRGRRGAAPAPSNGGGGPGSLGGGGAESAVTVQPRGLDEVDRRILEKLREHGGTMLQSQLLRETGLPKTTLWRHVQKLEKLGYIEVVREGRSNRLILRRDVW